MKQTDVLGECKLDKVESLEVYFAEEFSPDGTCRPCQVGPLASLYMRVLEDGNEHQAAHDLSDAYDTADILTIAKAMDTIKENVSEGVRQELASLDCFAQSYVEEASQETV